MNLFAPVTTTLKGSDRLALLSWRPLALRGVARLPAAMRRTPARRQLVVALFLGAILAAVELISRAGLSILERRGVEYQPLVADRLSAEHRGLLENFLAGRPSLFQHDAVLGWTLRPGFRSELCTIGLDGRRRDPERPEPIAPTVRVAAFGDSFTFGGDVADRYAYPEVLARLDAGLEVENFGVPRLRPRPGVPALSAGGQADTPAGRGHRLHVREYLPRRERVRTHTKRYTPLLRFLATKGYRVVDAMTALDAAGNEHPVDDLIPAHLSPLANQLVAEYLLE
jgi:hypothetical protein